VHGIAIVIVLAAVILWGAVSARLERADLTAPIVFTVLGAGLTWSGLIDVRVAAEEFAPLVELTLVLVLFADAARVRVHDLRRDAGGILRLLAIGLPLTVLAGWGLALWLLPGMGVWLALVVGAALAPTDAALGVPVVSNPSVPSRVRRLLTVESGLNDGIATPVVLLAIAGAAAGEGSGTPQLGGALLELGIGVVVGALVGFGGGWLFRFASRRNWADEVFLGVAVLALALLAYFAALAVSGNGFVAAFCGGIAFGAASARRGTAAQRRPGTQHGPGTLAFVEESGNAVSLVVWTAFGAVGVPILLERLSWIHVAYALLSLTLVRMLPVAVALLGTRTDRNTVLFVGWFGPRGLASLVFALLALEALGPDAETAVAVIALTVFLSVLAHGISAAPLAKRYGAWASARGPEPGGPVADVPVRGLPRDRGTRAG
jgi:sodium/hydrogen antiporter